MDEISEIKEQIIAMISGLDENEKNFLLMIYGLIKLHLKVQGIWEFYAYRGMGIQAKVLE